MVISIIVHERCRTARWSLVLSGSGTGVSRIVYIPFLVRNTFISGGRTLRRDFKSNPSTNLPRESTSTLNWGHTGWERPTRTLRTEYPYNDLNSTKTSISGIGSGPRFLRELFTGQGNETGNSLTSRNSRSNPYDPNVDFINISCRFVPASLQVRKVFDKFVLLSSD